MEKTLYRWLCADSPRSRRIAVAGLCVVAAAAMALLFFTGASPQRCYPCDYMLLLDVGHRVLQGQLPHVDFFSFAGPTAFLPVVLGMSVAGKDAAALAYGPALLLPLAMCWTWRIAVRRLPPAVASCLALMIGGFIVGTFSLGVMVNWQCPSYATQYNRVGWAIVCMLALAVLVPPRSAATFRDDLVEGISVGLWCGLLFFLKLNYAGAAVVFFGLGCLLHRGRPRFLAANVLSLLGVILLHAVYLHGDLAAYLRDLFMPLHVNTETAHSRILFASLNNLWELWPLCVVACLWWKPAFLPGQARKTAVPWLLSLVCAGVGIVIVAGNYQWDSVPLAVVAAAALAESFRRIWPRRVARQIASISPRAYRLRVELGYLAVIAASLSFAIPDFGSVGYSSWLANRNAPSGMSDLTIDAPALKGIRFIETTPPPRSANSVELYNSKTPLGHASSVNDGLQLLQRHIDSRARIAAMAFCNPFPFALDLPSPKGVPICVALTHMDPLHHPPAERVFSDATHVMFQKSYTAEEAWEAIYGDYVRSHFTPVDESPYWILYAPRSLQ